MNLTGQKPYQKGIKRRKKLSQEEIDDKRYLAWVREQPSCISRQFSEFVNGKWRNPACHVLRVKFGSGKGTKGKFNAIAMTHAEHDTQTRYGEAACLNKHLPTQQWTEETAKQWFEDQAMKSVGAWLHGR